MTRRTVYLFMALHVTGSAITYVLGKHAADGFPDAGSLTLARALLSALLLLALTGTVIPRPSFTRSEWLHVAALGVLLVPMNQYLFLRGLRDTVPAHAPLIYAMTPVGVLLLQAALARRRPPAQKLAGVVLALAGVIVLLRPWQQEDPRFRELRTGDLLILVGMVVWVVYTVAAAPLFRRHDPRTVTAWILVLGAVALAPFAGGALVAVDLAGIPAAAWWGLVWLAVVTSALMMFLWNALLRVLEPVEVAVASNVQPAATAALAAVLFHGGWIGTDQDLGLLYWTGTAFVLAGVTLAQRRGDAAPDRGAGPRPA